MTGRSSDGVNVYGTIELGATSLTIRSLFACEIDLALLSADELSRHSEFKNDSAADAFLRRHCELRRVLGALAGENPAELAFSESPQGKPQLLEHNIRFNVSSSGSLLAIGTTRATSVGVDIERRSQHPRLTAADMAPALHPDELERLAEGSIADLLRCWVVKEAWVKFTGEGMRADLRQLDLGQYLGGSFVFPAELAPPDRQPEFGHAMLVSHEWTDQGVFVAVAASADALGA